MDGPQERQRALRSRSGVEEHDHRHPGHDPLEFLSAELRGQHFRARNASASDLCRRFRPTADTWSRRSARPTTPTKTRKEVPGLASGLLDRLFSTNYKDFRFLQVFYPTRGILAWYDRKEEKMRPLAGCRRSQLCADQRILVAGRKIPDLQPGDGSRPISAGRTEAGICQRPA